MTHTKKNGRARALLARGLPPTPAPTETAPPARTFGPEQVAVFAELAKQREHILGYAPALATLRATERILAEAFAALPEAPAPVHVVALETLRAQLSTLTVMWLTASPALGLGPVPELSAAQEVDLRARILSQSGGQGHTPEADEAHG